MKQYLDYGRFAPHGAEEEIVDIKHVIESEGKEIFVPILRTTTENHWEN